MEVQVKVIDIRKFKEMFLMQIRKDRKAFKNTSIYYELLNRENCKLSGQEYGYTFNCLDSFEIFNQERIRRINAGYVYKKPVDVVIGGIKMKRIVFTIGNGKCAGDNFGIISGYLQADNEVVCYMVRY